MKKSADHHTALKAFSAFLIVALGAVLLVMFDRYSDKVYLDGNLKVFTLLALLGGVLLIGLLYFVSKPHTKLKK
jgi:hypothetical protein